MVGLMKRHEPKVLPILQSLPRDYYKLIKKNKYNLNENELRKYKDGTN